MPGERVPRHSALPYKARCRQMPRSRRCGPGTSPGCRTPASPPHGWWRRKRGCHPGGSPRCNCRPRSAPGLKRRQEKEKKQKVECAASWSLLSWLAGLKVRNDTRGLPPGQLVAGDLKNKIRSVRSYPVVSCKGSSRVSAASAPGWNAKARCGLRAPGPGMAALNFQFKFSVNIHCPLPPHRFAAAGIVLPATALSL